jgi:hypothetical protein
MIIPFPGVRITPPPHQHSRRRAVTAPSLHTHRRALLRRAGMECCADRPAAMVDTVVRALLQARV